jgi:hypothetical protein
LQIRILPPLETTQGLIAEAHTDLRFTGLGGWLFDYREWIKRCALRPGSRSGKYGDVANAVRAVKAFEHVIYYPQDLDCKVEFAGKEFDVQGIWTRFFLETNTLNDTLSQERDSLISVGLLSTERKHPLVALRPDIGTVFDPWCKLCGNEEGLAKSIIGDDEVDEMEID